MLLLLLLTNCRLTKTDVIGNWKEQFGDSLTIYKDNVFLLVKQKASKAGEIGFVESSKIRLTGQWKLNKKAIYFTFDDPAQSFGGDCRMYQYWWTRGSKKKLVQPVTCKSPTHHFTTIVKVD